MCGAHGGARRGQPTVVTVIDGAVRDDHHGSPVNILSCVRPVTNGYPSLSHPRSTTVMAVHDAFPKMRKNCLRLPAKENTPSRRPSARVMLGSLTGRAERSVRFNDGDEFGVWVKVREKVGVLLPGVPFSSPIRAQGSLVAMSCHSGQAKW